MSKRGWIASLAFLVLSGSLAPVAAHAACKPQLLAVMKVEFTDGGGVVVPVQVNEHPAWMYLALATGLPLAFPDAASQLGLIAVSALEAQQRGMAVKGKPVDKKVVVDSLRIGGANFKKWPLFLYPLPDGNASFHDLPVFGELTSQFMTVVDIELDLAHHRVALFSQAKCGMDAVYWGGEVTSAKILFDSTGLMMFPMEIDGKLLETAFNTGGAQSRISEEVTKQFFGFDHKSDGVSHEVERGSAETSSYRAMGLTAKGLSMQNVPIYLRDDRKDDQKDDQKIDCKPNFSVHQRRVIGFEGCNSVAPLSIGTDLLRQLRVYIASKEGRVYFTRTEPDPEDAAGVSAAGPASAPAKPN